MDESERMRPRTWFFLSGFDGLSQVEAVITLNHLLAASEPPSWLTFSIKSEQNIDGGRHVHVVLSRASTPPYPPPPTPSMAQQETGGSS